MNPFRLAVDAPLDLFAADLTSDPAESDVACLSDAEQARAARFRFPRDRRRYLAAHVALHRLLMDYTGLAPGAQRFAANRFGKPALAGRPDLDFSLSYAGDTALLGISRGGPIGVDAEPARDDPDTQVDCPSVFDAAECAAIAGAPRGPSRDSAFLRGWTRKEACLKAVGTGLSTSPSSFHSGVDGVRLATVFDSEFGRTAVEVGSFALGAHGHAAWARVL